MFVAPMAGADREHVVERQWDSRARQRQHRWSWRVFLWAMGAMPFLGAVTTPRFFDRDYARAITASSSAMEPFSRAALVLAGLALACGALMRLSAGRIPRAGLVLWSTAIAFGSASLISSRFGTHPVFNLGLLGAVIVFSAVALLPAVPVSWLTDELRSILLVYAYGSLLSVAIAPTWALDTAYDASMIPGFHVRLHGLANHANNLAALLATYVILCWVPGTRQKHQKLHMATVLLCLALTQSKTIWLLLAAALALKALRHVASKPLWMRAATYAALAILPIAAILVSTFVPDTRTSVTTLGPGGAQLETLSGRLIVWEYTLEAWRANPWFGYGPALWGAEMRTALLPVIGWAAPHAHNQLLQTLGESGLIGAGLLIIYTLALIASALRVDSATATASTALVLMLLIRGITEPPMATVIGTANFFVHFATFTLLLLAMRQHSARLVVAAAQQAPLERCSVDATRHRRGNRPRAFVEPGTHAIP